uniref:Uncharacterized protein n=1 Tax=Arundo donax TaxID=35708 RepID=A0A0A9BYP0_ARUDO
MELVQVQSCCLAMDPLALPHSISSTDLGLLLLLCE